MAITLELEYTSKADIINCINEFRRIQNEENQNKKLIITAKKKITEIDISLIAYFILFVEVIEDLEIKINLPFNELGSGELETRLKQYGMLAYLMTGRGVFDIVFKEAQINFSFQNLDNFPENYFDLPDDFLPILFFKKNHPWLTELLFETSFVDKLQMEFDNTDGTKFRQADEKELFYFLRKKIISNSIPKNRKESVTNLGRLAFISILFKAKVLSNYFFQDPQTGKIKINNEILSNYSTLENKKKSEQYFEGGKGESDLIEAFNELSKKPLIYHFVFCLLLSSNLSESDINERTNTDIVNRVYNLLNFTQDLVYGIKELAKNILDHSSTKTGVISGKLYNQAIFNKLIQKDPDLSSAFTGYSKLLHTEYSMETVKFLDLSVTDIGILGVVPTLFKKSEVILNDLVQKSSTKHLFEDDLKSMKESSIGFYDLLYPRGRNILNHQAKRSVAHLGLLIFTKLIEKNNGLLVASSDNFNRLTEVVVIPAILDSKLKRTESLQGTSYQVILPVSEIKSNRTHLPHTIEIPKGSTILEVRGVEKLMDYEVVEIKEGALQDRLSTRNKFLLTFKNSIRLIGDKKDEILMWKELKNAMDKTISVLRPGQEILVNWNFIDTKLDASHLFRAIGQWMTEFPSIQLIITNITQSVFQELLFINEEYCGIIKDIDYWNSNSVILVYSFVEVNSKRFYFADALWGKTEPEFRAINRLLGRNNINSTLITGGESINGIHVSLENPQLFSKNSLIFNQKNILPFDLLLSSGRDKVIFDENILTLLNNPITI